MLKFFRKYNKLILVVGGCFLMVAFLLPQALQSIGQDPMSQPVARLDGRVIDRSEMVQRSRELGYLQAIAPAWANIFELGRTNTDAPDLWILLTHEAASAGLVGGPRDGEAFLEEATKIITDRAIQDQAQTFLQFGLPAQAAVNQAEAQRPQTELFVAQQLEAGINATIANGVPRVVIMNAFAKAHGVMRLLELSLRTPLISRPEFIAVGDHIFDEAQVNVALVPAASVQNLEEPTEAELQAHFEQYREVDANEDPYGIGYLLPPGASFEWLTVARRDLSDAVAVDPIEMRKHFERNSERFGGVFADSRSMIRTELRDEEVRNVFGTVMEVARAEIFRAQSDLPRDDSYRVLPEDWEERRPTLDALRARIVQALQEVHGIEGVTPEIGSTGDSLLSQDEIRTVGPIGRSFFQLNQRTRIPTDFFIMHARELGEHRVPIASLPNPDALPVQEGLIYGPFRTGVDGDVSYLIITDTAGPRAPESLDDVRNQVLANTFILKGFEHLEREQANYEERLGDAPFRSMTANIPGITWQSLTVTERFVSDVLGEGLTAEFNVPEFRDRVMDLVNTWDPVSDEPAGIPYDQRTLSMILPSAGGLAVVQVRKRFPFTKELFDQSIVRLTNAVQSGGYDGSVEEDADSSPGEQVAEFFDFERLKARWGYESLGDDDDESDDTQQS
ncbi:MAG: hypothetical protein AAGD00_09525 [Planctomycetota bacterium]